MKINHSSRLGFLLELFNLREKELADLLYVDYTMVSKWVNKKRILNAHSPHLKKIVNCFITLDSNNQFRRLKQVLSSQYSIDSLEDPNEICLLLSKWLLEEDIEDKRNDLLLKINTDTNINKGYFYIFKDNDGRRKAIKIFLNFANSLPEGQEFLLFSQEDNRWFYEEEEFLKFWKDENFKFLSKKGKIHIIHTLDRSNISNAFSLLTWLPIDIASGTFSYLYTKFLEDTTIRLTIFILKNRAAIYGFTSETITGPFYTYLILDPITIHKFQLTIQNLLTNCNPMYEKSFPDEKDKIINLITKAIQVGEDNYFYSLPPSLNIISNELFVDILKENKFSKSDVDFYSYYQSIMLKNFRILSAHSEYKYIYNINKLEQALKSVNFYIDETFLFMGKPIKITRSALIKCIEETILALDKVPNLKIALSEGPLHTCLEDIVIWIKRDTITIFNKKQPGLQQTFSLYTHEITSINSFFYVFNQLWNSITTLQRDRDWTKQKLLQIISNFK